VQAIPPLYVSMSGDPLIGRAMGILGNGSELAWFKSFIYLEAYVSLSPFLCPPLIGPTSRTYCSLFQLPVFVLGARGLWRGKRPVCLSYTPPPYVVNHISDSPGIYSLLVLYGASTCTTTLACVATIIGTPTTSATTIAQKVISITLEQRVLLLCSYVPFFIIPLCIAVDMALRLQKLASAGVRALEGSKEK
jgi:sigma intracellular receptor 2